jgi:uncharacterized protein
METKSEFGMRSALGHAPGHLLVCWVRVAASPVSQLALALALALALSCCLDSPTGTQRARTLFVPPVPTFFTALVMAARSGKGAQQVVRKLLQLGADLNERGKCGGATPLIAAAEAGEKEIVKDLLAAGAKVNDYDGRGWTALTAAVSNGDLLVSRLLLGAPDCDVNARKGDLIGETPLSVACERGHVECAKLLLNTPGIDVFLRCNGCSPLALAAGGRHTAIVQYMLSGRGQGSGAASPFCIPVGVIAAACMHARLLGHHDIVALLDTAR